MNKKIRITFLALFFASGLFAQGIDLSLLKSINGPPSGADKTWKFISNKAIVVDIAAPVSLVVAGYINNDDNLKISGLQTAASFIVAGGATFVGKKIFNRDRPFITHPDVIYAKEHPTDASFPSGHTAFAFSTATSLSLAIPKWYVIVPSFAYASAVGYSRMYLGVHYPSDVLAGAVVGAGSAYLTWKLQKWIVGKKKPRDIAH
ncbi:phosphatase PAP2 family protein [Mucilaginibacter sp. FT3.2]|uniref:phosphatase PAP2 family protein n=1 Tax=Mucilaginibacter sp. FT3.2 TaxID=2723090 RepID=UPI001609B978|nr:undecaprenyl-diphosphatase [Mucilaginibacter sp. FT3.2]